MSSLPDQTTRRTMFVPVMTMEEVPVLSDAEREEFLASLREAEADIAAGRSVRFDEHTFKERFIACYRAAKRDMGQ